MKKFTSKMVAFLTALLMILGMLPVTAFADQTQTVSFYNPVLGETSTVTLEAGTTVAAIWADDGLKVQAQGTSFSKMVTNDVLNWGMDSDGNRVVYLVIGEVELDFKLLTQGDGKYIVGADGAGATIVRGSNASSDLIEIGEDCTLDFYNITLDGNGSADGSGCTDTQSGGLLAIDGTSYLKNCIIQNDYIDDYVPDHSTEDHGTGTVRISANNHSNVKANVTMEDCQIINNYSHGNGTGIYIGTAGTLTLKNSEVSGNKSLNTSGWRGAGIFMKGNAALNIAGKVVVKDNYSTTEATGVFPSDIFVGNKNINVSGALTSEEGSIGIDGISREDMKVFATGTGTTGDFAIGKDTAGKDVDDNSPFFHDGDSGCHVHKTTGGLIFCTDEHRAVAQVIVTLSYDANTGSGSMASQTEEVDEGTTANFTVAANGFTPPKGMTFLKWNTAADGNGTDYAPDAVLSTSENVTLYAIWQNAESEITTITLSYDPNGGEGEMNAQTTTVKDGDSASFEVAENVFTAPVGKEFQEWNTKDDGTGKKYSAGEILTAGESLTLYAIWKDKTDKTSYPGLKKVIVDGDSEVKATSVDAGDDVEFKLVSNVPQDLTNYLKPEVNNPTTTTRAFSSILNGGEYYLEFHDVMDAGLKLKEGSIKVTVNGHELSNKEIKVNTSGDSDTEETTIEVTLELVALLKAGYFGENDFGTAEIILTYTAAAANDLKAGSYINKAWVEYEGGETEKDEVTVDTYGIEIFKYDQDEPGKGLKGAEFKLVRVEDEKEITIKSDIISGDDGTVAYEGLKAGTYKLYETKAPEGYIKSEEALTINIPEKVDSDNMVSADFANALAPHTGGMGTRMYTIAGAAIILAAGLFFVVSRKKKEQ